MSVRNGPVEQVVERRKTGFEKKVEKAVEKEVKEFTYYNEKLIRDSYASGDIYSEEAQGDARQGWEINCVDRPYLTHVKELAPMWPSLRMLADFMEIGTSPTKWQDMTGDGSPAAIAKRELERQERASRTKVTRLDYLSTGIKSVEYTTSKRLKDALDAEGQEVDVEEGRFRLFIVEDLSRDVIEYLGAHLDIEPAFFREQIFDYAWYNIRDRWVDPLSLQASIKKRRWIQLRFPAARYYKTPEAFKKALKEFGAFNVTRRAEDDLNNKSKWDAPKAIVGLARTRAFLWLSGENGAGKAKGTVGVLLVDPTPKQGSPLWYGYRNWEDTPSMSAPKQSLTKPPRSSIYSDIVYWAKKADAFHLSGVGSAVNNFDAPIQALLHLISAEWLEASEYIRTRLGQIEWEASFPEHFLMEDTNIFDVLKKLHIWRRIVPLYREMLTETLERVFEFNFQTPALTSGGVGQNFNNANGGADLAAVDYSSPPSNHGSNSENDSILDSSSSQKALQSTPLAIASSRAGPTATMRDDFDRILKYMEEYQQQIDRLTSLLIAVISFSDSKRSREDNQNVARLTWLATFFIPLGFIASLFSMTSDVGTIKETVKWYFAASLPLAVVSLGIAWLFTLTGVKRYFKKTKAK